MGPPPSASCTVSTPLRRTSAKLGGLSLTTPARPPHAPSQGQGWGKGEGQGGQVPANCCSLPGVADLLLQKQESGGGVARGEWMVWHL